MASIIELPSDPGFGEQFGPVHRGPRRGHPMVHHRGPQDIPM
jgi:hypothetical protein